MFGRIWIFDTKGRTALCESFTSRNSIEFFWDARERVAAITGVHGRIAWVDEAEADVQSASVGGCQVLLYGPVES